MKRYREIRMPFPDGELIGIKDTLNKCQIPIVEDNRHYQKYLEWVAEGNTPDPQFTPEEAALRQERINKNKNKLKVNKEMRKMAIDKLKSEGKLPQDYTEDE